MCTLQSLDESTLSAVGVGRRTISDSPHVLLINALPDWKSGTPAAGGQERSSRVQRDFAR